PAPSRFDLLRAADFNTHRLPQQHIDVDLLTDSWGELFGPAPAPGPRARQSPEERFGEIYGYPHVLAVTRGRFAEALLAAALIRPGSVVACNPLFPSTTFHAEPAGA